MFLQKLVPHPGPSFQALLLPMSCVYAVEALEEMCRQRPSLMCSPVLLVGTNRHRVLRVLCRFDLKNLISTVEWLGQPRLKHLLGKVEEGHTDVMMSQTSGGSVPNCVIARLPPTTCPIPHHMEVICPGPSLLNHSPISPPS